MNSKNSDLWKPRNPLTQQKHRKEVFWQITVPILAGTLIMLILCLLAAGLSSPMASRWADISIIWLIPPVFLAALIFMAINVGSTYLVIRMVAEAPAFFFKVQNFLRRVQLQVAHMGDKVVEPVLRVNAWSASARAARREVGRLTKRS
jgi:hypothetical protein